MIRRTYRIQMETPIGNRSGILEIQIDSDKVAGYMYILEHREPFMGSIDENGYCSISGILVTLLNTIPYHATGQITSESLDLSLKGGRNQFPVTGTVFQEV